MIVWHLFNKVLATPNVRWTGCLEVKCRHWSVWVSFRYTVEVVEPSAILVKQTWKGKDCWSSLVSKMYAHAWICSMHVVLNGLSLSFLDYVYDVINIFPPEPRLVLCDYIILTEHRHSHRGSHSDWIGQSLHMNFMSGYLTRISHIYNHWLSWRIFNKLRLMYIGDFRNSC